MSMATMHTNHGPIEVELFDEDAPKTVGNFRKLAGDGFYDGLIFHRVIRDFMIQGGRAWQPSVRSPSRRRRTEAATAGPSRSTTRRRARRSCTSRTWTPTLCGAS